MERRLTVAARTKKESIFLRQEGTFPYGAMSYELPLKRTMVVKDVNSGMPVKETVPGLALRETGEIELVIVTF
jgi:hypothetical protein